MKRFLLSIAAWLAIGVAVVVLIKASSPVASASLMVLPVIAAAFTLLSRGASASGRPTRIGWWVVTLCGWGLLTLLALGRWETARFRDEQQQILIGAGLTMIMAGWLMVRLRSFPTLRTFLDAGAAAGLIALGAGGTVGYYEYQTRQLAAEVKARWVAIGRPMDAFEKTLTPREGNAALAAFGEILLQQVNAGLYKRTDANSGAPVPKVPDEAIDVISWTLPPTDVITADGKATPILDSRAQQLDAAYARILAHEAPMWAVKPEDTYRIQVPNFLGLRMFAQLIAADATRRLRDGDIEGAKLALAAAHRANEGLPENPTLVSVMIRVAIDAMMAPREVRLPATPGTLEAIAADSTRLKSALIRALQFEAWALLRMDAQDRDPADYAGQPRSIELPLPTWVDRWVTGPTFRRELSLSALATAEQVAILQNPQLAGDPDRTADALEDVFKRIQCRFAAGVVRAGFRMNAALLLREQSALLRLARERMASGQPLESRESIVFPGRRWHFQADPAANTVTLKLDPIPQYIANHEVTDTNFWILPLDGSKAWQFRAPTRTAHR